MCGCRYRLSKVVDPAACAPRIPASLKALLCSRSVEFFIADRHEFVLSAPSQRPPPHHALGRDSTQCSVELFVIAVQHASSCSGQLPPSETWPPRAVEDGTTFSVPSSSSSRTSSRPSSAHPSETLFHALRDEALWSSGPQFLGSKLAISGRKT